MEAPTRDGRVEYTKGSKGGDLFPDLSPRSSFGRETYVARPRVAIVQIVSI